MKMHEKKVIPMMSIPDNLPVTGPCTDLWCFPCKHRKEVRSQGDSHCKRYRVNAGHLHQVCEGRVIDRSKFATENVIVSAEALRQVLEARIQGNELHGKDAEVLALDSLLTRYNETAEEHNNTIKALLPS